MALAGNVLCHFLLVFGDQLVRIFLDGLVDLCVRLISDGYLGNIDLRLIIIFCIFKGAEGYHLGNGSEHRNIFHGICGRGAYVCHHSDGEQRSRRC